MLSNSGDGVEMTATRDPRKQVNDEKNGFLLHGHSFLHFGKLHYCAQTSTPLYGFSFFCVVDVFKIYLPNTTTTTLYVD